MSNQITCDRRLYVTADKSRVVEAGDSEAAFLLAAAGGTVPGSIAEAYGLSVQAGRVTYANCKRADPVEDKMRGAAEDKAWDRRRSPAEYLRRYPNGPRAALARRLIE
ncbi:hypothetical protein [Candidatus Palauibacter sp.]|uniref:hypothetical protein n=1 Tax=Candidatus Palauibacter sp. TaxID=3101350 RepID=UPI003CC6DD08